MFCRSVADVRKVAECQGVVAKDNSVRSYLLVAAVLFGLPAVAAPPPPVPAVRTTLTIGADYWMTDQAVFHLTAGVAATLNEHVSFGGRFGALLTTTGPLVGLPLDAWMRFYVARFYADLLAGPWIMFTKYPVRFHAAGGFGYQLDWFSIGIEAGYLDPGVTVGLRVGFTF